MRTLEIDGCAPNRLNEFAMILHHFIQTTSKSPVIPKVLWTDSVMLTVMLLTVTTEKLRIRSSVTLDGYEKHFITATSV